MKLLKKKNKFVVGDKVRIVGYGHKIWFRKGDKHFTQDIALDLLGKEGIISVVSNTDNDRTSYSIAGIGAWFYDDQLELVTKNKRQ